MNGGNDATGAAPAAPVVVGVSGVAAGASIGQANLVGDPGLGEAPVAIDGTWRDLQGVGDFFPKGTHPNPNLGEYGTAECFPLPIAEYVGNPNIRK